MMTLIFRLGVVEVAVPKIDNVNQACRRYMTAEAELQSCVVDTISLTTLHADQAHAGG